MPKLRHEAVVEILQNEPELVLHLLACAGMHLRLGTAYVANARRRHGCDTLLMIFAVTENAARGSARAILTGHPGWDLIPLVSGIGRTPGIPLDGARFAAELVLLRVITGELMLGTHDARMFALTAIRSAPPERLARYTKYLKALSPPPVRESLEMLMRIELKDPFVDGLIEQGLEQGRKKGLDQSLRQARAEMFLELLEARFSVPDSTRERIEACTDTDQVKAWFKRAISASSLDEVFAEAEAEAEAE
jgi:hypothetical protein